LARLALTCQTIKPAAKAIATTAAIKPFVVPDIPCPGFVAFLAGVVAAREAGALVAVVGAAATVLAPMPEVSVPDGAAAIVSGSAPTSGVEVVSAAVVSSGAKPSATSAPQFGQVRWPSTKIVSHS
jgi:hypothetical protein